MPKSRLAELFDSTMLTGSSNGLVHLALRKERFMPHALLSREHDQTSQITDDLATPAPHWLDRHAVFDELLSRTVQDKLTESGYWHLRQISVAAKAGRVHLQGKLPTYFLKQMAQEMVACVPGVSHVENHVHVEKDSE